MDTAPDPFVGRTIGQYEIVAKRGGGGMGIVYTARDARLGRLVALKFLPPQWSHDETAKQRFVREAQAASATDHRNICTIHDIRTADDGQLFIVMAHYDGPTLKERLDGGPLPIDEAIDVAAQIAEGLGKAHGQGIVHRDIKPGNLILTDDSVKILDFGLAKFADAVQLTIAGSTLGTVAYMSPEQVRAEDVDVRSDIWAVGIVLYEMLAGAVPFKGAYAEAIFHGIRTQPPPPIERSGVAIPEALWRIVTRCLEKDPAARYQTARELARDLRLLQGRTLPIELRPDYITPPPFAAVRSDAPRGWTRIAGVTAAAVVVMAIAAAVLVLAPVERAAVVVAPVGNQTGYKELESSRLPLTQLLTDLLLESRVVRVVPYERVLQIIRPYRQDGRDASSREALQTIAQNSGAAIVIVPTLLYEGGTWRARIEYRDAATATNQAADETAPIVSSLINDTTLTLAGDIASAVDRHFTAAAPLTRRVALHARLALDRAGPGRSIRSLEALAQYEQGVDAHDLLEFAAADAAFTAGSERDQRSPALVAWHARIAALRRNGPQAEAFADQAGKLLPPQPATIADLFFAAMTAEARQNWTDAERLYRALANRQSDQWLWQTELAAFLARRGRTRDAIEGYQRALQLDAQLPRPDLELCRLYNRSNESASAAQYASRALTKYQRIGDHAGEAQTQLCLTDTLRVGDAGQRAAAAENARKALATFVSKNQRYNVARARHYVALVAEAEGDFSQAAAAWEQALEAARDTGNRGLEAVVLMDLGVVNEALGHRQVALDYYERSSKLNDTLGEEREAARSRANAGELQIEHGDSNAGLRELRNAEPVFRKIEDKNFEAFAARVVGIYYRNVGNYKDAERELNRAVALSRERDLSDEAATATIELGRLRFDLGSYVEARESFDRVVRTGARRLAAEARILMARVDIRLGNLASATALLRESDSAAQPGDRSGLEPLWHEAMGELANEQGVTREASAHFSAAAAMWTDELPDIASIEARAYAGWLSARSGGMEDGRRGLVASLQQADRMQRRGLAALCRLLLARIDATQHRFEDAHAMLTAIPDDTSEQTIGPELRAQVLAARSEVLNATGEADAAAESQRAARRLLQQLRDSLPESLRASFAARSDIRAAIGE